MTHEGDFVLGEHAGALDLRPPGEHERAGIQAIFPPDGTGSRAQPLAQNPLVKAFGKHLDTVFDLTAGLGGDAYRLAAAGFSVLAFERDPRVFAVLESGWRRACQDEQIPAEVMGRLSFEQGEGGDQIAGIAKADVGVYIDPMYPAPRKKSAKPRRELQILRALLGAQEGAADLVLRAREKAARVVVKRPHHAEPLVPGANHEIETKLVRFDVYLNPARMSARS